jgi:hypothetical protein
MTSCHVYNLPTQLYISSSALSVPYSNFISCASCLVSYGTTIGLQPGQPSISLTEVTAITPYVWSVVPELAAPGNDYRSNIIISAAWSSASTVVAVGYTYVLGEGLILRSVTGGSTWSVISISVSTNE